MTDTRTEDNPALMGGGAEEDRLSAAHFVAGALFLVFGGLVYVLMIFSMRFGDISGVSYGRLEPMGNLTLMLGFAVITFVGGIYYVLPRLTGTRLAHVGLARTGLFAHGTLVLVGVIAIGFGFGTGRDPLSLPWWLHLPFLVTLSIPAVVAFGTVTNRTERRSFVTIWFVLGAVVWLPLLYLAYFGGELPDLGSLAVAYSDLFFSAGFVTMFLMTAGSGLFYYTLVKEMDVPLASRQLAVVGFWSLGFAGVWWGVAQLVFGPGPTWLAGVAAALGLAFPIGAIANAANASITLEGNWENLEEKPGVLSGVVGLYMAVAVALMASFASFPAIGAVAALTEYWEGIEYASLLGVGALLAGGVAFHALPRLVGRDISSLQRARSFVRLTLVGSGGVLIGLAATGIVKGYSWIAGSNAAAYIDAGEGWTAGPAGTVDTLLLLTLGFSIVALFGHLAYASVILGTITTGTPVPQEILLDVEEDTEVADE